MKIFPFGSFMSNFSTILDKHIIAKEVRLDDSKCPFDEVNKRLVPWNHKPEEIPDKLQKECNDFFLKNSCELAERADNELLKYMVRNPNCLYAPKVERIEVFLGCRKMHKPLPTPRKLVEFLIGSKTLATNRSKIDFSLNYNTNELIEFYDLLIQVSFKDVFQPRRILKHEKRL